MGRKNRLNFRSLRYVALYGLILTALAAFALFAEKPEAEEAVYGSLEGRFTSDISLDVNGETLHYRENEITNYLLIGVDRRSLSSGEYRSSVQADFLMMLSIDRRNRTVTPVMIDRDAMTPVMVYGAFGNPAGERTMQVCLAQAFSGKDGDGSANTAKAVTGLLHGVKVNRCLTMDIEGISLLNDAVGGVSVTIEDDLTPLDPALRKGATVRLKGDLAEFFVRGRMSVSDGTNASRMTRQKEYINALANTLRERLDSGALSLQDIFTVLSGHMEASVSENVLLSEANIYSDYEWLPLRTLPGRHALGEDGFVEFHADEPGLYELLAEVWFA